MEYKDGQKFKNAVGALFVLRERSRNMWLDIEGSLAQSVLVGTMDDFAIPWGDKLDMCVALLGLTPLPEKVKMDIDGWQPKSADEIVWPDGSRNYVTRHEALGLNCQIRQTPVLGGYEYAIKADTLRFIVKRAQCEVYREA